MAGEHITADEQLARWVAGESIHRPGAPHGNLRPLDPPGTDNRRWGCSCGSTGLLAALRAEPCRESGECCPDFSCCKPELAAAPEVRAAYAAADDDGRHRFNMHFLGAAIAKATAGSGERVHIAGRGGDES